jgi:hypothetical protein
LISRPLTLEENEIYKTQLEFKRKIRISMKDSFYFIEVAKSETNDFNSSIERYSDRYTKLKKVSINDWLPGNFQIKQKFLYIIIIEVFNYIFIKL